MPRILYTVRTKLPTPHLLSRYLAWLVPDHIAAVKAGGAEAVRVILPDAKPDETVRWVEVQYAFQARTTFETYLRDHAPALRADSLKHFPAESGITFERQVAEIAAELE